MKITFVKKDLQRLVEQTKAAPKCHVPYTGGAWGSPEKTTPGLNLVGDDGVYWMSNRLGEDNHSDVKSGGSTKNVIHALECPAGDWEAKRRAFGGDDGVEFVELPIIEKWLADSLGKWAVLDLTPKGMEFLASGSARRKPVKV